MSMETNLAKMLIRQCRQRGSRLKVADSTGAELSGVDLLMRILVLQRLLPKDVLANKQRHVGLLLPPSAPAVVANFAVSLARCVAVNLNYTVSEAILNQCIELAEIKHVITSRKVMEKLNVKLNAEMIYLEDYKEKVTLMDKVHALLWGKLLPISMLESRLGLAQIQPNDVLTIIFTSGSTGVPKGVVLTYKNIASNVHAIETAIGLNEADTVLGVLPFFHSFGYTVTLWAALSLSPAGVYHYNPLEPRQIGKLAEQYKATVLLGTPTFLRTYLRRVEPNQFKTLQVVVAGAEKLPQSLIDAFAKQFGVRPVEGYGTTELSPLVSVNIPPNRGVSDPANPGLLEGSVGRPVPEVEARIVSIEDGKVLTTGNSGMLQIRGPNVMQGYLKRPDLTAAVMHGEWYDTGDIAFIDDKGFIHITGRQSRFSKIGGEMIPHIQIEETIGSVCGSSDEGAMSAVVTAVPDEKKGERLIVLYTELPFTPGEILKKLAAEGLPNLYLPSEDSFLKVAEIPVLGSGKLDLRAMKQIAMDNFAKQ